MRNSRYFPPVQRAFAALALILSVAVSPTMASAQAGCQPVITIDTPTASATVQGSAVIAGWAVDATAAAGQTGVQEVRIFRDGEATAGGVLLGTATGTARPDVDLAFGLRGSQAGWTLNADFGPVAPGPHTLYVSALTTCGWSASVSVPLLIRGANVAVNVDTPFAGQALASNRRTVIGGWAVDPRSSTGTGVDLVHIYADAQADQGGTLLGVATYGKPRADVATLNGRPDWVNSGFDFVWSVFAMAPGPHTLYVAARSTATGRWSYTLVEIIITTIRPGVGTSGPNMGALDPNTAASGNGSRADNPYFGNGYRADNPINGNYGYNQGYNQGYNGGYNQGYNGQYGGSYNSGYGNCPAGYVAGTLQCNNPGGGYNSNCPAGYISQNGNCYQQ